MPLIGVHLLPAGDAVRDRRLRSVEHSIEHSIELARLCGRLQPRQAESGRPRLLARAQIYFWQLSAHADGEHRGARSDWGVLSERSRRGASLDHPQKDTGPSACSETLLKKKNGARPSWWWHQSMNSAQQESPPAQACHDGRCSIFAIFSYRPPLATTRPAAAAASPPRLARAITAGAMTARPVTIQAVTIRAKKTVQASPASLPGGMSVSVASFGLDGDTVAPFIEALRDRFSHHPEERYRDHREIARDPQLADRLRECVK